jgi:pimeloyl-ACP methyl ester carboxylesterase
MTSPSPFRRGLVQTTLGKIHYTAVGTNNDQQTQRLLPIVAFHMSPRSVDEYKEVMECACRRRGDNNNNRLFIAMDELGYGQSDIPNKACSLEEIADCFLTVLDHLGVTKCVVVGSLMGCYFALSLAARYPDRIKGVVCTNLYYFQKEARKKALEADQKRENTGMKAEDGWDIQDDGSHIANVWGTRSSWLTPELNTRATLDNLNYLLKRRDRYAKGIYIQDGGAFPLHETCSKIQCPVLCINGEAAVSFFDMIGMNMSAQFEEAVSFFPADNRPETIMITTKPGNSINMINENAEEWYEKVTAFADKIGGQ